MLEQREGIDLELDPRSKDAGLGFDEVGGREGKESKVTESEDNVEGGSKVDGRQEGGRGLRELIEKLLS